MSRYNPQICDFDAEARMAAADPLLLLPEGSDPMLSVLRALVEKHNALVKYVTEVK